MASSPTREIASELKKLRLEKSVSREFKISEKTYSSNCHHQQDYTTGICPYCNCDQQVTSVTMVTDSDVTELALTLKTILHTQSTALPDMVQLMYT